MDSLVPPTPSNTPETSPAKTATGLHFERRFTREGVHPYDEVTWERRTAAIANEKGETVFEQQDCEVPAYWSQMATNVVVSKYFRGPQNTPRRETSVKQMISRVVDTIAQWGRDGGYFAGEADAQIFQDELCHLILHQKMAFNSPVWFNIGVPGSKQQASACQPYDARVATPDGMIEIGALVERNACGQTVFDRDGLTRVVATKMNGRKEVFRVTLSSGVTVDATADHIVLTSADGYGSRQSWKRLDQLELGERLIVDGSRTVLRPVSERRLELAGLGAPRAYSGHGRRWSQAGDVETWYARAEGEPEALAVAEATLAGWLQGDGYVGVPPGETCRSFVVELQPADEEELREVERLLDAVFPGVHRRVTRSSPDPAKGCFRVRLAGDVLWPFLDKWQLLQRGTRMSVPDQLWQASSDEIAGYLGGLFQADGYVSVKKGTVLNPWPAAHIGLGLIAPRLCADVQQLLLGLGICSALRHYPARPGRQPMHVLDIGDRANRLRFAELVGFPCRRKSGLLKASLDIGSRQAPKHSVRFPRVTAIESRGVMEVFDIQTESGNYLSNHVVVHNCFIQSVEDTMDSILTLAKNEGMLFKYGSGTGSNLSPIRSAQESLAGGGTASGPVSFMKGFDAFAGVIKSGGTTRRAAKMVILNADHPDVEDFITCKVNEERKAWALIEAGYDGSFTGEAYASIFFQNSNNSVRVTDEFMRAVEEDKDWNLYAVTDKSRVLKTVKARELMHLMAESAWQCGDPGIQYDTTINDWHTSSNTARINASNPCFPGDARVHTTAGLVQFAEMYRRAQAGERFRVYTHRATADEPGEGVLTSVPVMLMQTGAKTLVRLQFSNGQELRCTPNHRLWTLNRGYVHAADLEPADRVMLNDSATPASEAAWELPVKIAAPALSWNRGQTAVRQQMPEHWTAALGELTGHLIGDGCMTADSTVWEYGGDDVSDGLTSRHARKLRDLFGGVSVSHMDNGTVQLRLGAGAVRDLFSGLGVTTARAHEKKVPEAILTAPPEIQAAFLRGLFGADGCISLVEAGKASRYVGLGSRSKTLLRDVQKLLSSFGIRSRIYSVKPASNGFTYTRVDGETVGFDLRITGSDLEIFSRDIRFSTPRKQEALEALLGSTERYATKRGVRLVSREAQPAELVYNLTEPLHHSYIVDGVVVANCSEYMYLDDSACNLASINLMRFLNEDGSIDIDAYRDAIHLTITAQEIMVSNASYPTEKIGRNSEDFRPLGLGYANLGALLMARGVPYDSPRGRDLAACLTAVLTGEAYAQSARIAREIGTFNGYQANRQPMLRVIGKHREAAYNIPTVNVESNLITASRHAWDEAHELGARHGYRNGQATVLAHTGTISFLLDCDTTGVEPDIALVKYKKLVGGGMLKIVNQTVPAALRRLGYGDTAVADIIAFVDSNDTIEGAPPLHDEDVAVFDCAFTPRNGKRSIAWQGHVRMMAAVQPFISGAISKTVNMPGDASVEDVERAYIDGWKQGLKALAIYRDGSKRSQPLATSIDKTTGQRVQVVERPLRRRLPSERQALTHRFEVSGHEGYITVGLYEDGTPGEIFLKMAKEGSTVSGLMDSFATAISLALQYGVPLQALIDKFSHTRFEPQGFTKNPEIPIAKSVLDYIFRWLASRFLPQEERDRLGIIRRDVEDNDDGLTAGATLNLTAGPVARAQAPSAQASVMDLPGAFVNQADAPSCSECGSLMVRNGACYKCHNCGSTSGCS